MIPGLSLPPLALTGGGSSASSNSAGSDYGTRSDWVINMGGSGTTTQNATPTSSAVSALGVASGGTDQTLLYIAIGVALWLYLRKH
jgi:hypothetical protein